MTVKQVIEKYHKIVPFPVSPAKLKKAGYSVKQYFTDITSELNQCIDKEDGKNKKLLAAMNETLVELEAAHKETHQDEQG